MLLRLLSQTLQRRVLLVVASIGYHREKVSHLTTRHGSGGKRCKQALFHAGDELIGEMTLRRRWIQFDA